MQGILLCPQRSNCIYINIVIATKDVEVKCFRNPQQRETHFQFGPRKALRRQPWSQAS